MENLTDVVQQQAKDALRKLGIEGVVPIEHIVDSVLHQTVYWDNPLPNGEKLLFMRLHSPVVQREEVFLGNILFNAFLGKAFVRAIADRKLGSAELVANDLQSYYFLVRTSSEATQLTEAFSSEVGHNLPDLFFGVQDEARGLFGSLETMLQFEKANVEPFPVFIMPQGYAERLEKAVRKSLLRKIEKSPLDRNPTSIMANLAFFYSHDGAEMQSPYLFLARLAIAHEIVDRVKLQHALSLHRSVVLSDHRLQRIRRLRQACASEQDVIKRKKLSGLLARRESVLKELIESTLKQKEGRSFSSTDLRKVLEQVVTALGKEVDEKPDEWRMPYIRDKFLPHDERVLMDVLLDGISLGGTAINAPRASVDVGCRICSVKPMKASDKSILMGQNTHRFHNQSAKQNSSDEAKTCLRCATCTYLIVKLLGSEAIGQPQVPKTYNLIFHYGKHDDAQVRWLTHQIDLIWNLVQTHQQKERSARDIRKVVNEAKTKWEHEKDEAKKERLKEELQKKQTELEDAQTIIEQTVNDLFKACPWLAQPTSPAESCSLEVLATSQLSEAKTERHVLGLGMGGYRMILFILPQLKRPRGKKGEPPPDPYVTQRRFSDSRVAVTALLSFLRQLCGCDGPFYYQSSPILTPDAFRRDTFYVRNEAIDVHEAQNEYEVVTQLAWKLIWQRGSDGFVRKVVLAEKLLHDPLGTFAGVMRDSAILGQTKGSYKRLPGSYRQDWKAQDLTEYVKFIQRLSTLKR